MNFHISKIRILRCTHFPFRSPRICSRWVYIVSSFIKVSEFVLFFPFFIWFEWNVILHFNFLRCLGSMEVFSAKEHAEIFACVWFSRDLKTIHNAFRGCPVHLRFSWQPSCKEKTESSLPNQLTQCKEKNLISEPTPSPLRGFLFPE